MVQLPPEVYNAITSYVSPRDLVILSRTSKALQRAAEPRIYEVAIFRDAQSAFIGCHAISIRYAVRATYVKRLVLYQDPRRALPHTNLASVPPHFWLTVQQALIDTVNLEYLTIHDPLVAHSWILHHDDIRFQLREANFRLPWDAHLVAFLQTQHKLQFLQTGDSQDDGPPCNLPLTALQTLHTFSGPVFIAAELIRCSLTRLQIVVDEDTAQILPTVVADLGRMMKSLRNLSIVGMPEAFLVETLQLVSTSVFAPNLRFLGVLLLPTSQWHGIQRCLMKLSALEQIELDVSRWDPHPHEYLQRAVLLDLRIYCPTLHNVVFWVAQHRYAWFLRPDGEWVILHQTGRHPAHDTLWRTS